MPLAGNGWISCTGPDIQSQGALLHTYCNGKDICIDGGYEDSIMAHIPGRPTRDI